MEKKYEVIKEIEHNGQRIPPGAVIELSDSLAAYLLQMGDVKKLKDGPSVQE